jgi:cytochrome c oxidase subunit II
MNKTRRNVCAGALAGVAALLAGGAAGAKTTKERVVKIEAKKFTYTPNRIILKKGQAVALQLTALDFMHGFKIPDWNIRADLPPGQVTTVHIHPDKAGEFDFLCDNFCGDGHEEMSGKFVVTD